MVPYLPSPSCKGQDHCNNQAALLLAWSDSRCRQAGKRVPNLPEVQENYKKYGKLPPKVAETKPWENLCVDLIGPYNVHRQGKKPLKLQCLTMVDPATGWFEIIEYKDKSPNTIANLVEQEWITRYPNPDIITFDKGKEFIGKAFSNDLIQDEYGIKIQRTTTANPQSNAIVERIHQTLGNML